MRTGTRKYLLGSCSVGHLVARCYSAGWWIPTPGDEYYLIARAATEVEVGTDETEEGAMPYIWPKNTTLREAARCAIRRALKV